MFSLSTSWNSYKYAKGSDIIKEIKSIGFDTVELNFSLTENIVKDIVSLVDSKEIKVSSLHNICPLPKEVEPAHASPDYYSLASDDIGERGRAVDVTKNTISYAKRLGARAVVLHIGRIEIKDRIGELASLIGEKDAFDKFREKMVKEREDRKGRSIDNVIKSLEELVPFAKDSRIALGIENRYYYREIPLPEELEILFKRFPDGSLYYWHDTGHAEVFERLGLGNHKDTLDRFSNRLLGIHLHDIIGSIHDHQAPGFGTFDFRILKPYLKADTIKVIETHRPATPDVIRRSVEYLTKILG
ncbi:MAG: hypothetical protein A2987_03150 [Omnitrophica bacterium RIFCSPLOWO2_01_FULL_45_10]|nr:MAG: hypothetical protein A2987_03150 [Omnitrophica bacterium RIFCSPLOWO2_01_FULL_45_10]